MNLGGWVPWRYLAVPIVMTLITIASVVWALTAAPP
jgi:hypothetical protein